MHTSILSTIPYRAWINQPSHHQPLHHLHGTPCIVVPHDTTDDVTLYFTHGQVHSMQATKAHVSPGDPE